jgi:DNA-binding MarR family transcriptional regulator
LEIKGGRVKRPAESVSHLEAHLGYWLRFVSNHVSHAFSVKLDQHRVTVAEWVVLRELFERETAAPSELADRLGMTRGAISKLADRLIAKGLATRAASVTDKRRQTLTLTPQGRALVPKLSALADQNDAEFFGHLNRDERTMVETTMKEIVRRHAMRAAPVD